MPNLSQSSIFYLDPVGDADGLQKVCASVIPQKLYIINVASFHVLVLMHFCLPGHNVDEAEMKQ